MPFFYANSVLIASSIVILLAERCAAGLSEGLRQGPVVSKHADARSTMGGGFLKRSLWGTRALSRQRAPPLLPMPISPITRS